MSTAANVNTPAAEHTALASKWARIDALLAGTDAMRAAGETYLPKFSKEDPDDYKRRLAASVLFGAFEQTVSTMVGMPFAKPITLGEDVPARLKALAEDIDQAGNHLDVFARERFRRGLAYGSDHILVDMDASAPGTAADDLTRRPRWIPVSASQLIDARKTIIDGKERFTHVRIRETITEWDGYTERRIDQVREIVPPLWRVWRMVKDSWTVHMEGAYESPYVTLAPFYAGVRTGTFTARPPLDNLAHLNVAHWQTSSDQRNILTVSRFAILFLRDCAEGKDISIGPNTLLRGSGEKADAKYVEHQGHAIEAGERDIDKLEKQMEAEGVRMLTRRPGNITATENAIDEAKDQSELETIAGGMKDCLEQAMLFTAEWLGESQGGSLTLNGDYGIVANAAAIKDAVLKLREMGDLSAEDAMTELQKARLLSGDLDIADAVERASEDVARTLGLGRTQNTPPAV